MPSHVEWQNWRQETKNRSLIRTKTPVLQYGGFLFLVKIQPCPKPGL